MESENEQARVNFVLATLTAIEQMESITFERVEEIQSDARKKGWPKHKIKTIDRAFVAGMVRRAALREVWNKLEGSDARNALSENVRRAIIDTLNLGAPEEFKLS